MHVRRRDMIVEALASFFEQERVWAMEVPRSSEVVGDGEPNTLAAVIGEVQEVFTWRIIEPFRGADE
jgi:hypothetical protein